MPADRKRGEPPEAQTKRSLYYQEVQTHGRAYAHFDWPSVEVILNLLLASDELETHMAARMARHGLSLSAFNVLTILNRRKDQGAFPHELSELLLVTRANTTGLIDTLVKQGLVSRDAHSGDRRKCIIKLTASGQALLDKILPPHFAELKRIASGLSAAEKKEWVRLTHKFQEGLKRAGEAE